jgi:hypothetical protein
MSSLLVFSVLTCPTVFVSTFLDSSSFDNSTSDSLPLVAEFSHRFCS